MARVIAGLFLSMIGLYVFAQANDRLDFKGLYLGSDISLVRKTGKYFCHKPDDTSLFEAQCFRYPAFKETIGGVPIEVLTLNYVSKKLMIVHITVKPGNFDTAISAIEEKYGKGKKSTSIIENNFGAKFENRSYEWRRNRDSIKASLYGSKINESVITFTDDDEFGKRFDAREKKRGKDL